MTQQMTPTPSSSPRTKISRTPPQLKSGTSNTKARHVMCRSAVTRRASLKCDGQRDDCFPTALVEFFRRNSEDHTEEMAPLHRLTDD